LPNLTETGFESHSEKVQQCSHISVTGVAIVSGVAMLFCARTE